MVGLYRREVGRPVGSRDGCTVDMARLERVRGHRRYSGPFQAGGR